MSLGSSSMGNGNVGTSYGDGNLNAGSGISIDGSGFSDRDVVASGDGRQPEHALPITQGY